MNVGTCVAWLNISQEITNLVNPAMNESCGRILLYSISIANNVYTSVLHA